MTARAITQLSFGAAFGFVLGRNGAADFDAIRDMFLFRSFHLFGVAIVSTALTSLGLLAIRRLTRRGADGRIRWGSRSIHRGTAWGAAVFGVGWGVTGTCPGTALVQLGQGHLIAAATVMGIVAGMVLRDVVNRRFLRWESPSCD